MIAGISFALLVLVALGYVMMPIAMPGNRTPANCVRCGAARGEGERYCAACGLSMAESSPPAP